MTAPGALAITGVVLMFAGMILVVASEEARYSRRWLTLGFVLLAAAGLSYIGAAWWEALR